jgi:hypothetical protein
MRLNVCRGLKPNRPRSQQCLEMCAYMVDNFYKPGRTCLSSDYSIVALVLRRQSCSRNMGQIEHGEIK